MRSVVLLPLFIVICCHRLVAAGDPIVLIYADSLVGMGPSQSGMREFIGQVQFRQGDVTVTCDRALHYVAENRADLFGRVVVTQGTHLERAPQAAYDGNTRLARASGGVEVTDQGKKLTSQQGTYSTLTHVATFKGNVKAESDTITLWSDRAVYHRETKVRTAAGNVVARDSIRHAVLRCDTLYHDPNIDHVELMGHAAVWRWKGADQEGSDTSYVIADTIDVINQPEERYICRGSVELVSGTVSARADSLDHRVNSGKFHFFTDPVLWADSSQLLADTIIVDAPDNALHTIAGYSNAMMISRSDSLRPDRFDQVAGRTIFISIEQDTIRRIRAIDQARSITWHVDEDGPEGLSKLASDTIVAEFDQGQPVDIYWLGIVEGEHHPEPVAGSREGTYKLEGFDWRVDRPLRPPVAQPYGAPPPRTPLVGRAGKSIRSGTEKKK
jgi:lipopolysaccharide export system protein LptA